MVMMVVVGRGGLVLSKFRHPVFPYLLGLLRRRHAEHKSVKDISRCVRYARSGLLVGDRWQDGTIARPGGSEEVGR